MKSEICLSIDDHTSRPSRVSEPALDIFFQMELLGINPDPFIEIAAQDLINQYGNDALNHSWKIIQEFKRCGDHQSANIWIKITTFLGKINESGALVAN